MIKELVRLSYPAISTLEPEKENLYKNNNFIANNVCVIPSNFDPSKKTYAGYLGQIKVTSTTNAKAFLAQSCAPETFVISLNGGSVP
jgi:hypothetical protein